MTYATTTQLNAEIARAKAAEGALDARLKKVEAPVPPPSTYAFEDTFDGNLSKWRPTYQVGDAGYGLDSDFLGSLAQTSIANGILTIKAERKATPSGRAYASASLSANFSQAFGTWEMRMRCSPSGMGVWPALWMLAQGSLQTPPEVDLVESYYGGTASFKNSEAIQTLHTAANASRYFVFASGDLTTAFHVYKLVWTATSMEFSVDGTVTGKLTTDIPQVPMYPILSMAMGAPGFRIDGNTPALVQMDVDYVRIQP